MRTYRTIGFLLALVAGWTHAAFAARLPIRTYTSADGLPASTVKCLVRDSRGFFWLCTEDGLIRFDGYSFVTYGIDEGIPDRGVNAFLETRGGAYWIGTRNGAARFRPEAVGTRRGAFLRYAMPGSEASQFVTALTEDRDGTVWCGTRDGIFRRVGESQFQAVDIGLPTTSWKARYIKALAVDKQNWLWTGTEDAGIYRRAPDGRVQHYQGECQSISALLADRQGRIWAGSANGVCLLAQDTSAVGFAVVRHYATGAGLPNIRTHALLERPSGEIWVGTEGGIGVLSPGATRFASFGAGNGMADDDIRALGADPDDNIWAAANSCLMRLARTGFLTYTTSDGLGSNQITSIFEDRQGSLYVANGIRDVFLNRFDGESFHSVKPRFVRGTKPIRYLGWGNGQIVLRDVRGDWWFSTGEGLCRFEGIRRFEDLARVAPAAVYTRADGLPGNDIFRIFEDSHGDLWIGTVDTPGLTRWDRSTGTFQQVTSGEGYRTANPPAAFVEDRAGDLWVGLFWKGLARRRQGRWEMFAAGDDTPSGSRWAMLLDHCGHLWIASSSSGLTRVDNPSAEVPKFVSYTTRQGLSSDLISSLTEDHSGRIYIGSERGVDVLDPVSGRVLHLTASDGLTGGDLKATLCDRSDTLWFGATLGLSRMLAKWDKGRVLPPVRITGLRTAGGAQPVSALGETALSGLELLPGQNRLDVEFASFNFQAGNPVRFQYRLNGENHAWEDLGQTRAVHLDGLAPGSYRFQVRAVSDGLAGGPPALLAFRVLPPLWRRWWSITLMIAALMAFLYSAYRIRVGQLVEMERVRTRIAMDLHDDIGASLSQIAILSEVARKEASSRDGGVSQHLSRVADISRELAGALGDIVWAVNPQRDRIGDLVQRMRRFGGDLLNSRNIDFACVASQDLLDTEIGADVRRQVLLVFKESVHNIARHSGCTRTRAELTLRDRQLCLAVTDDGTGFDAGQNGTAGNGLPSMQKRAEQIGGSLRVNSARGQGTTILLTVPLRRHYPFGW